MGISLDADREHGLTPAQVLDQAFTLLRRVRAGQWLRGMSSGLPLATVLLALYTFVHVFGVRPPLALFGLLCALGYGARFRGLSRLSGELVCALAPGAQPIGGAGQLERFTTAMVAGISSWFWAVTLWAAAQSSLSVLLVCFPLLCARGAFAPSLLARSACAQESGLQAMARASADSRGQRSLFLGVELLVLLGLLLLFGNLYALTALALLVASSLLGLDVSFVTALIAPDNEIVPLLLLGVATFLIEPMRAAISALAFQRARERWDGADLHAAIAALASEPRARPSLQPKAAVRALLLLLALCPPSNTQAQPPHTATERGGGRARDVGSRAEGAAVEGVGGSARDVGSRAVEAAAEAGGDAARDVGTRVEEGAAEGVGGRTRGVGPRAEEALADVGAGDARARERAQAILGRDEFLPSGMDAGDGTWRRWWAERMRERELSDRDASAPPRFELRLPSSALVLGSVVLLAGVGFWLTRSQQRRRARAAATSGAIAAPTSDQRLAEATAHAQRAQYELGVRSLYGACLSALGRFDSAQTNGQVLQGIQHPPLRAAFARFTQVIEPCCYGQQPATREDFEHARVLTDEILRTAAAGNHSEVQP